MNTSSKVDCLRNVRTSSSHIDGVAELFFSQCQVVPDSIIDICWTNPSRCKRSTEDRMSANGSRFLSFLFFEFKLFYTGSRDWTGTDEEEEEEKEEENIHLSSNTNKEENETTEEKYWNVQHTQTNNSEKLVRKRTIDGWIVLTWIRIRWGRFEMVLSC